MRNAIAASGGAENTSIFILSTDDRPLAACLHETGYLTDTELAAIERREQQRQWRWWERALWVIGLADTVAGTA
jgi:hypothetical protein